MVCMKLFACILTSLLLLMGCHTAPRNKPEVAVSGPKEKFQIKGFNIGIEIYLRPDYTFLNHFYSRACQGGFFIKEVTGTYRLDGAEVTFTPQTMIFKEDWESHEIGNTTRIDTVAYYASDSTRIQTKYRIVEVSGVRFLVSESRVGERDELFYRSSNFIALANLYNSCEQRAATDNLLANKDTVMDFRNLNVAGQIPAPWRDYFLADPIQTTIRSVRVKSIPHRVRGSERVVGYSLIPTYKLDAGSLNGLKEGMLLYSPKRNGIDVTVIRVEEADAVAEGMNIFFENTKFNPGTILSTKKE